MTEYQTYVAKCEDCGHVKTQEYRLLTTKNLSSRSATGSGKIYSTACSECNSESFTILDVGEKYCKKCATLKPKLGFANPKTFSGYGRFCNDCEDQIPISE